MINAMDIEKEDKEMEVIHEHSFFGIYSCLQHFFCKLRHESVFQKSVNYIQRSIYALSQNVRVMSQSLPYLVRTKLLLK